MYNSSIPHLPLYVSPKYSHGNSFLSTKVVAKTFEAAGGRLIDAWMAFGEYDVIVISEFPNNVDAVALSMTIASSGSLSNLKTTVLISMDDAVEAMKLAGQITGSYTPPN